MLKALLSNKEKLQELANTPLNENCSAVILKKLPEKLGDPGKFFILCGFSELKCKALADLGASINLMPLSVWKKLGLPDLIPTRMTLELANRAICTPDRIARDVFVPVVRRSFLRTARALIDVHGEEMILRDGDERLTLNMKHDTASYSNHPRRESVNLINIFNISREDCLEDLVSNKQSGNPTFLLHKEIASSEVIHEFHDSKGCTFLSEEFPDIDSFNDIHPYFDDDPLSDSTTYSANSLLEEFADELARITYPLDHDDNRTDDVFPSPDNEDKVFNPRILIHEKFVKIITRFAQEKKLAVSYASWLFEDFDPPSMNFLFSKRLSCFQNQHDFLKPDEDFSCSKWKEYSSLGCSSVPFLSP
nr:reverse transcriptase domain-containing protein [Tanacetum cinerariifolium]